MLCAAPGVALGVAILRGALDHFGVREMAFWDEAQYKWVAVGTRRQLLLEWLLKQYSTGVSVSYVAELAW